MPKKNIRTTKRSLTISELAKHESIVFKMCKITDSLHLKGDGDSLIDRIGYSAQSKCGNAVEMIDMPLAKLNRQRVNRKDGESFYLKQDRMYDQWLEQVWQGRLSGEIPENQFVPIPKGIIMGKVTGTRGVTKPKPRGNEVNAHFRLEQIEERRKKNKQYKIEAGKEAEKYKGVLW